VSSSNLPLPAQVAHVTHHPDDVETSLDQHDHASAQHTSAGSSAPAKIAQPAPLAASIGSADTPQDTNHTKVGHLPNQLVLTIKESATTPVTPEKATTNEANTKEANTKEATIVTQPTHARAKARTLDAKMRHHSDVPTDISKLEPPHEQHAASRGVSLETLQDRSIEAVVSLLDDNASKNVRAIWAGLEDEFGLQKIYAAPFPHFSYHSAERYDETILSCLAEAAADLPPFTARVSGIGVFAAPKPIVYLAMVRNTVLSHHHELLWSKLVGHAYTSNLHYHPEAWVPHITLAQGDVTNESLPAVMTYLSAMTFDWDIHIDNIALVFANGLEQGIKQEFELGEPVEVAPETS
jgi:hypothetical protein